MKRLTQFQLQLSSSAKLDTSETQNLKGGLRYTTVKYNSVLKKVEKLEREGHVCCVSEHNGEYCIEW